MVEKSFKKKHCRFNFCEIINIDVGCQEKILDTSFFMLYYTQGVKNRCSYYERYFNEFALI